MLLIPFETKPVDAVAPERDEVRQLADTREARLAEELDWRQPVELFGCSERNTSTKMSWLILLATLFVRNVHGTVVGGLLGGTFWNQLYV